MKKSRRYFLLALIIVLCFGILAGISSAVSVDLQKGEGSKISSTFLTANRVRLVGRIYETSDHGAYFTNLVETSTGSYVEDTTIFKNYTDTGSHDDNGVRYNAVYQISTTQSTSCAWKVRINPYRLYNDARATAFIRQYP